MSTKWFHGALTGSFIGQAFVYLIMGSYPSAIAATIILVLLILLDWKLGFLTTK